MQPTKYHLIICQKFESIHTCWGQIKDWINFKPESWDYKPYFFNIWFFLERVGCLTIIKIEKYEIYWFANVLIPSINWGVFWECEIL